MEIIVLIIIFLLVLQIEKKVYIKYLFLNLEYTCSFSKEEVFEGDEIEIIETISNNKWLPISCLKSELTISKWLDFIGAYSEANDQTRSLPSMFALRGYQKITRRWKIKCLKRGVFTIGDVALVARDLMNLCVMSQVVKINKKVTVLPKPYDGHLKHMQSNYILGDTIVKRFIIEDPFYTLGVRNYTDRDPMNKIHWGATAKQQEIMVYHNDYTSRQDCMVILNMQSHDYQVKEVISKEIIEKGIKVCAALFEHTLSLGIPVGFMTNSFLQEEDDCIATRRQWGKEHIYQLYLILAHLKLKSTAYFGDYLMSNYFNIESTDIILVTCFISKEIAHFVRRKKADGLQVSIVLLRQEDLPREYSDLKTFYFSPDEEVVIC